MDFLISESYLILEDSEYPVVLTGNTDGLLKEKQRVLMKLPKERPPSFKPKELILNIETKEFDQVLFDKLRKLRKEIASKEAVPAYIVFSDATLRDMSLKKPVSMIQFSAINGVGNIKLEKYGGIFTEFIRDNIMNNTQE